MTNNVRLTFSDGGTAWAVYNWFRAREIQLLTLDTICSGKVATCLSPLLQKQILKRMILHLEPTVLEVTTDIAKAVGERARATWQLEKDAC